MKKQHICIRDCYVGVPGRRRAYRKGERLRDHAILPSRHFVPADEYDRRQPTQIPFTHVDDPRSTVQILMDLRHRHGITLNPEETSRKYAFERWRKAEEKAMTDPSEKEKPVKSALGASRAGILTRSPGDAEPY